MKFVYVFDSTNNVFEILYIIREIISTIFVLSMFFTFIIHIFRICRIIKTNVKTWNGGVIECMILIYIIIYKYLSPLLDSLWTKLRTLIYKIVKNKQAIWVFDSFLYFEKVKLELTEKKWKFVILRGSIYFIAAYFNYFTFIFYNIYFHLMALGAAKDILKDFIYPYHTNFKFQTLPFPLQQRFFELQKPVTRYRFSKACFLPSLKSVYNKKYVDNLFIRRSKKCHMIYENFVHQQSSPDDVIQPSLTIGCNIDAPCNCTEEMLNNIFVVRHINVHSLPPSALSHHLPKIDFSNVKFLEIFQSFLNFNDLEIISKMNLKFASLLIHDDGTNVDKMKDILNAVIGVPNIRIWYVGECHNPDDFGVYLVEWVLENGYIDSIVCTGRFLGEHLTFKSSKELSIYDAFNSF